MTTMEQVQPGWYPDPTDKSRLRKWDGTQWVAELEVQPIPRHRATVEPERHLHALA